MNKNLFLVLSFLLSVSAAVAGEKDVPLMLQPVAVKKLKFQEPFSIRIKRDGAKAEFSVGTFKAFEWEKSADSKVVVGLSWTILVYKKGEKPNDESFQYGGLTTSFTDALRMESREIQKINAVEAYTLELQYTLFETTDRPEHIWSPEPSHVLKKGAVKQDF